VTFWRDLWLVLAKDLRLEVRRLEGLASMVFLAVVTAMVLALALGAEADTSPAMGTGVLWVSTLLAATMGLARLWQRERQLGGFRGLLLTPASRSALFLGKSLALTVSLALTELVLLPLVCLLFRLPLALAGAPLLALVVLVGCFGLALIGVLLGAIAARARAGELLLGAIMYPLVVPLLVGGVKGTAALLSGAEGALQPWIGLMLLADAVFVVAGLWLFESLVVE
jgi:heme exporter protein CcmB